MQSQPPSEFEPIAADAARAILDAAILERLGAQWDDPDTGWDVVSRHDYMARLTRGRRNIDFYVDLTGAVRVEEKMIGPGQENARFMAWLLLIATVFLAVVIAWATGFLS